MYMEPSPAEGQSGAPATAQPASELENPTVETLPDGSYAEHFLLSRNLVGKIIGRGGTTVHQLQAASGAFVHVQHDTPGEAKRVTIYGTPEAVASCKEEMQSVIASDTLAGAAGVESGQVISRTFACPQAVVGRVIGRGGETIRSLQSTSGAHIHVEQNFPEGEAAHNVAVPSCLH